MPHVFRPSSRVLVAAILALAPLLHGATAPAQAPRADSTSQKTFFVPRDLGLLAVFGVASYGVSRFDVRVAKYLRQPVHQNDRTLSGLANNFTKIQETTLTLGGLATYGIARLAGSRDVADIAIHATEAVVLSSLTSQVIRGPLGRSRPHITNYEDPYDFHAFQGFGNFKYRAFPSIHTSSSFAAATVIVMETHRRSPRATWIVAPVSYLLAAGPGYSRMFLGQHWASDIFMGAFMGTFYGVRVASYSHGHPDNRVDRFFLGRAGADGLQLLPSPGGGTLSWSLTF